jgi:hypothetical protein
VGTYPKHHQPQPSGTYKLGTTTMPNPQPRSRSIATPNSPAASPKQNKHMRKDIWSNNSNCTSATPSKMTFDSEPESDVYAALLQGTGQSYGSVRSTAEAPLHRPYPSIANDANTVSVGAGYHQVEEIVLARRHKLFKNQKIIHESRQFHLLVLVHIDELIQMVLIGPT